MEEETTTNAPAATGAQVINGVPVNDQGMALPVVEEQAAAESTTTEPSEEAAQNQTSAATPSAPSEPSEDELLTSWAKNKGLELDSDNAKKAAKIARDNELAFKKKAQQSSDLEKSMTDNLGTQFRNNYDVNDPNVQLAYEVQGLKLKDKVRDFFQGTPDAEQYRQEMAVIAKDRPHLTDLDAIYALAKSNNSGTVRRDVLTDLAHKQQTAVPTGNATNAQTMSTAQKLTPQNVNEMVAKMSVEEYEKRLPEINAAMTR